MVSNSSPKVGSLATKSLRCKSLVKCNNTKLEGNQFQDELTPFTIRDLHHEDPHQGQI